MSFMSTLQLSFHGPFLYRFTKAQVEIYAPKCPGHAGGLFTAKNEIPLTGRHRQGNSRCYRIGGPVFTPPSPLPAPRFYDPERTILDASKAAKPALDTSHFSLVVPLPQTVVPMSPSDVEVVDNSTNPPGKPTSILMRRATALRFYYQADLSKNLMLTLDNSAAPVWAAAFDAPSLGHDFADVEIRYTSGIQEDQEHQDAHECFDRLARLTGVDWWLCYEDPSKPYGTQAFGKTGNDCRAPILTIS
jgi:hypothetical protein